MQTFLAGVMLVGIGAVYLNRPDIFRRGIWMKTSLAIRLLSEDNCRKYRKGLGIALIVIGAALIVLGLFRLLG